MKTKKVIAVLITLTMCIAIVACDKKSDKTSAELKEVETATVKKEKISNLSELSGTLSSKDEVTISFETGGRIISLNKKEGDPIKIGDILAALDDRDYLERVRQATAGVQQAEASLNQVTNGARPQELEQAKASVESLTAVYEKAASDLQRAETLYKSGYISKSDYENVQNQGTTSKNNLESAKQSYSMALEGARQEQKDQAVASYALALSSKEQASLVLEKTVLKSSIDGIIIEKYPSQGQLIGSGSPVYKIGNIDTLKAIFPVPDHEINLWKVEDKVNLTLYKTSREGVVTNIFPSTNQGTGTISVEVNIPNPNHDWIPGQVVDCLHNAEGTEGLFVPVEAVINTGNGKPYVFLAEGNKAKKFEVTIGTISNNKLEITSGLKEGDTLISKGADRLFNNDPIKIIGGDKK